MSEFRRNSGVPAGKRQATSALSSTAPLTVIPGLVPRLSGSRRSFPLRITVRPSELDRRIVKQGHRHCLGYRGGSGDA